MEFPDISVTESLTSMRTIKGEPVFLSPVGGAFYRVMPEISGALVNLTLRDIIPFPGEVREITGIQRHDAELVRAVMQFRRHADYDIGCESASRRP